MREVVERIEKKWPGMPGTQIQKELERGGVTISLSALGRWMRGGQEMSPPTVKAIGPLVGMSQEEIDALVAVPDRGEPLLIRRLRADKGDDSLSAYIARLGASGVHVTKPSLCRWFMQNRPVAPDMVIPLVQHLRLEGEDVWQVFADTHRPPLSVEAAKRQIDVVRASEPGTYDVEGRTIDGWERYRPWLEVLPADPAPARPVHRW